jgi:hypothetical protein
MGNVYSYDIAKRQWEQTKVKGDLPPSKRSGYAVTGVGKNAFVTGRAPYDPSTKRPTSIGESE